MPQPHRRSRTAADFRSAAHRLLPSTLQKEGCRASAAQQSPPLCLTHSSPRQPRPQHLRASRCQLELRCSTPQLASSQNAPRAHGMPQQMRRALPRRARDPPP
jgi:hypothetical protein